MAAAFLAFGHEASFTCAHARLAFERLDRRGAGDNGPDRGRIPAIDEEAAQPHHGHHRPCATARGLRCRARLNSALSFCFWWISELQMQSFDRIPAGER